jgi:hypothetical protein
MVIDHLGIVVRSLEQAIRQWEQTFGYKPVTEIVPNTRQKVRAVFLGKSQSLLIKLIEPSEPASPVSAFARRGGGLHQGSSGAPPRLQTQGFPSGSRHAKSAIMTECLTAIFAVTG